MSPSMAGGSPPGREPASRFARLSSLDLMFLRVESAAWPCHFGGLAILDGPALCDTSGRLRLGEIAGRLNRRLEHVPQFRRRVLFPGLLQGKALWVDHDRFDIHQHVRDRAVDPPGGDIELLDAAARICGDLLDRSRPSWELWFLTGLSGGRVGVLLKLHHSVADGMAAVMLMASLFDAGSGAPEPAVKPWAPQSMPKGSQLLLDNLATKHEDGAGAARRPRYLAGHQHAVNVEVTNVTGPPVPVYLFGAPVLAVLPIVGPVGNMGPILCAFSYAGQLFLVVTADAHGFPDLGVLMAGMEADARALLGSHAGSAPADVRADTPAAGR